MQEKGNLAINSENIMPIIKKWLYSDSDIFLRELVSNATDAINKLNKLQQMGEAEIQGGEKYRITVYFNKDEKTIKIEDNGIGMTADEIKQYINQIAFSGANDFVEKYKDKIDNNDIIGHFGLGFYSAFMVADRVQIDTLSYKAGAAAARWISDGNTEYEMTDSDRNERGSLITLYVNDDSSEFLDEFKLRQILKKYCGFLPIEIYLENEIPPEKKESGEDKEDADDDIIDAGEVMDEDGDKPLPINNTSPLWLKKTGDCTDEEYKKFYRDVFPDFNEPLFWIHLNMDYPFRLKGILYFPKFKHELEAIEGQVKLFNNQVFIADNIKEVIPEFLLLLKGIIDCPDLPLNVSRSFLQNDSNVAKMSTYIIRKVGEKLVSVFNDDREAFNGFWDDINQFIKYGCIKEKAFYEKVKKCLVYKSLNGEYLTVDEYLEKNEAKAGKKVFYVTNEQQQAQYIKLFKDEGIEAVMLTTKLDAPYMSFIESETHDVKFQRIDSDLSEALTQTDDSTNNIDVTELFKEVLKIDSLNIKMENLKNESVSAIILLSEQSRRMKEMSVMFGGGFGTDMFKEEETLVLNKSNSLIKHLMDIKDDENRKDRIKLVVEQIYDIAVMTHKPLSVDAMTKFVERSNKILKEML